MPFRVPDFEGRPAEPPVRLNHSDGNSAEIDQHPNLCPICHHKITPEPRFSKLVGNAYGSMAEVVYVCPNRKCQEIFIAYFGLKQNSSVFPLVATRPVELAAITFDDMIEKISQNFCDIYRESYKAEGIWSDPNLWSCPLVWCRSGG